MFLAVWVALACEAGQPSVPQPPHEEASTALGVILERNQTLTKKFSHLPFEGSLFEFYSRRRHSLGSVALPAETYQTETFVLFPSTESVRMIDHAFPSAAPHDATVGLTKLESKS